MNRIDLADLAPFRTLVRPPGRELHLPAPFDAVLEVLPWPTAAPGSVPLVVNFVSSLDGAVRLSDRVPSSRSVALGSEHDWLLVVLLRTLASTVVIGSTPIRANRGRQDGVLALPDLAAELGALRAACGLGPLHHVVVSGRGVLPARSPVWDTPATVVTTPAGREKLDVPASVEVIVDEDGPPDRVSASTVGRVARARTAAETETGTPGFVLAEPGPTLFGELVAAGELDELFLTSSPVLAGPADGRLALTGAPAFARLELVGLSTVDSLLFGRWRVAGAGPNEDALGPAARR